MHAPLRRLVVLLGAVLIGGLGFAGPSRAETADTTPPVLRSVSVAPGPYVPGQQITWTFDIVDESPIAWLDVVYATPSAAPGFFHAQIVPPPGWRTGALSWTIPSTSTSAPHNGDYQATSVGTRDTAGRSARYQADGKLVTSPPTQPTHGVNVLAPLTITESPRDVSPPVLTSFSLPASSPGNHIEVPYSATDQNLRSLAVFGRWNGGDETELGVVHSAPTSGTVLVPADALGLLDVTRVVLHDRNENSATYRRDGTFTTNPGNGDAPLPHGFDLDRPVRFVPDAPGALQTVVRSGGATLTWSQDHRAGHRVSVSPGGAVLTGEPRPVGSGSRSVVLPLRNGVTHTVTITPTSPAGDGASTSTRVTPRMSLKVFGTGDHSGDGRADLWATGFADATSDAHWRLYTGAGGGRFGRTLTPSGQYAALTGAPGSSTGRGPGSPIGALTWHGSELREPTTGGGSHIIGTGFGVFRSLDASSDFTSDGVADLIGITHAGDFYLYPGGEGSYAGTLGRGVRLGGGWAGFHAVFSPGDFNGDRRADVVAIDALGSLWLYPGTGRGAFGPRTQIGTGWGGFGSVLPLRDFSGDGKVDIGAITMDGRLWMYPGNGRGGFLTKAQVGTGWGMFL